MLKDLVYFIQTDTTVGFLSQNPFRLSQAKQRVEGKSYIKAVTSTRYLPRVPQIHKNRIRRAKKTTFIYPNGESYRIVDGKHRDFVAKFGWIYTTSANQSRKDFDLDYAIKNCDVIVEDQRGLSPKAASKLIKLYKRGFKRLR